MSKLSCERREYLWKQASAAARLPGEFWECGTWKGGSAATLAFVLEAFRKPPARCLRLFDTFAGLPQAGEFDGLFLEERNRAAFDETSLEEVQRALSCWPFISFYPGLIPSTFAGLEDSRIAFAHIDVDLYQSTRDCLEFIVPRIVPGGHVILDDYFFCLGASKAVEEYRERGLPEDMHFIEGIGVPVGELYRDVGDSHRNVGDSHQNVGDSHQETK